MDWTKSVRVVLPSYFHENEKIERVMPLVSWLQDITKEKGHIEEKLERLQKLVVLLAYHMIQNEPLKVEDIAEYLRLEDEVTEDKD